MQHLQRAIRRRLFAIVGLIALCAIILLVSPGSDALRIVAIAAGSVAVVLLVLALIPLGASRADASGPGATEPRAGQGFAPQSGVPPQQGFAPPQHGQAPRHPGDVPPDEVPPPPVPPQR